MPFTTVVLHHYQLMSRIINSPLVNNHTCDISSIALPPTALHNLQHKVNTFSTKAIVKTRGVEMSKVVQIMQSSPITEDKYLRFVFNLNLLQVEESFPPKLRLKIIELFDFTNVTYFIYIQTETNINFNYFINHSLLNEKESYTNHPINHFKHI